MKKSKILIIFLFIGFSIGAICFVNSKFKYESLVYKELSSEEVIQEYGEQDKEFFNKTFDGKMDVRDETRFTKKDFMSYCLAKSVSNNKDYELYNNSSNIKYDSVIKNDEFCYGVESAYSAYSDSNYIEGEVTAAARYNLVGLHTYNYKKDEYKVFDLRKYLDSKYSDYDLYTESNRQKLNGTFYYPLLKIATISEIDDSYYFSVPIVKRNETTKNNGLTRNMYYYGESYEIPTKPVQYLNIPINGGSDILENSYIYKDYGESPEGNRYLSELLNSINRYYQNEKNETHIPLVSEGILPFVHECAIDETERFGKKCQNEIEKNDIFKNEIYLQLYDNIEEGYEYANSPYYVDVKKLLEIENNKTLRNDSLTLRIPIDYSLEDLLQYFSVNEVNLEKMKKKKSKATTWQEYSSELNYNYRLPSDVIEALMALEK